MGAFCCLEKFFGSCSYCDRSTPIHIQLSGFTLPFVVVGGCTLISMFLLMLLLPSAGIIELAVEIISS